MFSRYDAGIYLDEEGWFSVTPEPVAAFMAWFAKHIDNAYVVDCCCGAGGNIIQFALLDNVKKCYAVDLDPLRNKYAKLNALKYLEGGTKKIDF